MQMFKNDSVPAEVDIQIRMGIARGEKAKRTRKIRKLSSVAVLLIMAVFLGTINISSVAANYLASALGMENLVIWLRLGRPINNEAEFVIENRYLQHVNVSTEQDGVTFTIE